MVQPLVYSGSWEDLAAHAEELEGRNDLLLIVPARPEGARQATSSVNLAEAMKDYVGSSNYDGANLSENSSEKFAALLVKKHQKGQK